MILLNKFPNFAFFKIIEINLEDVDYSFEDYKDLYNYVNKKIDSTKINVIDWLLNEK